MSPPQAELEATDVMSGIKVIDTDSHVTELPDLWTSRLPARWKGEAPRVEADPVTGRPRWRIGDLWSTGVGMYNVLADPVNDVGKPDDYPEMEPGGHDPMARLRRLDEYGVWGQVLYPNLVAFDAGIFMHLDPDLAVACVRVYNEFLIEFASSDPRRFIPLMMVPLWDVPAVLSEMERGVELGHKGIVFGGHPERAELPPLWDTHWDPVWAKAQDMELSVNFHAGFASFSGADAQGRAAQLTQLGRPPHPTEGGPIDIVRYRGAKGAAMGQMNNMSTIIDLTAGGVCARFPRLKMVSVESGFGYIPYLLELLDFHWRNMAPAGTKRDELLPSEYFRRQMFGTFWFEASSVPLMEDWQDQLMFQTDFPHRGGLTPTQLNPDRSPKVVIRENLAHLPEPTLRKLLHDNAATLYHLDE
jgi:predicted TIM-barrel fold metal-dependent hydrolase